MLVSPGRLGRPGGVLIKAPFATIGTDIFPEPTLWVTTAGAGASFNTSDGPPRSISVTAAGATSSIRIQASASFTVVSGAWYRATWSVLQNNMFYLIGNSNGGSQYKSAVSSQPVGSYTFDFYTTSTSLWLQFQRTGTGTSEVQNMTLYRII